MTLKMDMNEPLAGGQELSSTLLPNRVWRVTARRISWSTTARLFFQILLALFACGGVFVVLFVPYHFWDALAYGEWSRLIAETGKFHFPTITAQSYHRPLLYVSQGWNLAPAWLPRWDRPGPGPDVLTVSGFCSVEIVEEDLSGLP